MNKAKSIPPEVLDYLDYNPETGIITWKMKPPNSRRIKVGQEAGTKVSTSGYINIFFKKKLYLAHRLAYFIHHGVDPAEKHIDHIDGNRFNNKIDNLRLATNGQNLRNRQFNKNNTSGIVGVSWDKKHHKWKAIITYKYKRISLGYFDDIEEAKAARIAGEKKYFGEFRNDCNDNI